MTSATTSPSSAGRERREPLPIEPVEGVGWFRRAVRLPFVALIRFYQLAISPWTASSCRYYPSCSQYALIAIQRHGVLRGGWLAIRRLGRCHPWTPGGVDHVPPRRGQGA